MIRRILIWLGLAQGCYQVYGGPMDGQWTDARDIPGYKFAEDMYSERRYHVWLPFPVTFEVVAEALDNARENTEDDWPWRMAVADVVDDMMHKCADVEDADPEVVRRHVERYLRERRPSSAI